METKLRIQAAVSSGRSWEMENKNEIEKLDYEIQGMISIPRKSRLSSSFLATIYFLPCHSSLYLFPVPSTDF